MASTLLVSLLAFSTVGALAQSLTTKVVTATPAPNEVVYITTACSATCPPTDNSGNALIASSNCGTNCLFCRWNWPGGNHFAQYDTTNGAVTSPIGVAANPVRAAVTCATSTSTSTIYPSRTTSIASSTPTPGQIVIVTKTCASICPPTDNSGNALIETSNCGTNCLFCRWNWPGGNHFAQYNVDTGAVSSPIGVAANPTIAAVACTTSTSTSIIYPSRTTAVATSTPTPGEIVSTTTTCSSICPPTDNSGNALIESSNCGSNCIFCRWNWPGGNHFAQYYVDTGAVFSPIGVAANPNFAAVACTTSAATSFLPSSTSASITSTPTSASITSTPTSSSASSVSSTPTTSIASGWSAVMPCATDTPSRILTNTYITNSNTNTPLSCTQNCFSLGFTYAAVEYGDECYCGTGLVSDVAAAPISECNVPCAGDATITCGAGWRMQVYDTTLTPPANIAPSGWKPYGTTGCSQDSGSRVFANSVSASGIASTNSPAACMSYCANHNYTMSGVENGSECYCGSAWTDGTPASDIPKASCGQACPGAPGATCGGSWAIQIYVATSS